MAEQEHKQRPKPAETEAESTQTPPASSVESDKIKADLDSLLDEIDEVLEGNAEEFVRNYVQKGGE